MKTAMSIPDNVFEEAEKAAKRLRLSRSGLYTRAIREFLENRSQKEITDTLNRVYAEETSALDPALVRMQTRSLPNEDW